MSIKNRVKMYMVENRQQFYTPSIHKNVRVSST